MEECTLRKVDHDPLFWGETPPPSSLDKPDILVGKRMKIYRYSW